MLFITYRKGLQTTMASLSLWAVLLDGQATWEPLQNSHLMKLMSKTITIMAFQTVLDSRPLSHGFIIQTKLTESVTWKAHPSPVSYREVWGSQDLPQTHNVMCKL